MSLTWFSLDPAVATEADLKVAFRRRAQACHPDKGGTELAFQELQARYSAALQELALRDRGPLYGHNEAELENDIQLQPDPCPHCNGTGRVQVQHGFSISTWPCDACGGTGVAS